MKTLVYLIMMGFLLNSCGDSKEYQLTSLEGLTELPGVLQDVRLKDGKNVIKYSDSTEIVLIVKKGALAEAKFYENGTLIEPDDAEATAARAGAGTGTSSCADKFAKCKSNCGSDPYGDCYEKCSWDKLTCDGKNRKPRVPSAVLKVAN